MGVTSKRILEKISVEKRWEITAKMLIIFSVLRGSKTLPSVLGTEEGIIAPVWGWEKWVEILTNVYVEDGRQFYPWVKERFNIPVEDAIGAANLVWVAANLMFGPEWEMKYVEKTPERVVVRWPKCPIWKRYKECEVDPAFIPCVHGDQAWGEEGLKAVNPKITYTITKAMPRGDPYCEMVYEFKDE